MEYINLNDPLGAQHDGPYAARLASENYNTITRRLITKIIQIINENHYKNLILFDRIYMSISMMNFLSSNDVFLFERASALDDDGYYYIGRLMSRVDVYVDMNIQRNHIKFSISKDKIRDIKIEQTLNVGSYL